MHLRRWEKDTHKLVKFRFHNQEFTTPRKHLPFHQDFLYLNRQGCKLNSEMVSALFDLPRHVGWGEMMRRLGGGGGWGVSEDITHEA